MGVVFYLFQIPKISQVTFNAGPRFSRMAEKGRKASRPDTGCGNGQPPEVCSQAAIGTAIIAMKSETCTACSLREPRPKPLHGGRGIHRK